MRTTSQKQRLWMAATAIACVLAALLVFRPGERASAGVDLSDPTAWIEHGLGGEVLQVNGATGEIMARVGVAEAGEQIMVKRHGTGLAVLNQSTAQLSVVDASQFEVTQTIDLELDEGAAERDMVLYGRQDAGDEVLVLDSDHLFVVDLQTETTTSIALGFAPDSSLQTVDGRLLALDEEAMAIRQHSSSGMDEFAALPAPVGGAAETRSIIRVGEQTWLLDPERLAAVQVFADGSFGRAMCVKSSANGALAAGSGVDETLRIVGYNPTRSIVHIAEPETEECWEFDLELDDDTFGEPVVRGGFAYLPNWTSGRIEVIDLDAERRVRSLRFGSAGQPFDLRAEGNIVWANEPLGPFAAVVNEGGLIPISKVATLVAGAVEFGDDGDGSALAGAEIDAPGLRALGDSGEEVITSANPGGDAPITGGGVEEAPSAGLDAFGDTDVVQPEAIGIAVEGPGQPNDAQQAEPPEPTVTLIANFGVSTATAKVDEVVRFTDFSSGSPTSWTWDFGDGTGAQEPNVETSWSEPGLYTVELIVRNARGDESRLSTEVTVVAKTVLIPPTADFVFDRNTVEVGEAVGFESRTVGDADILEWDFGDGTTTRGTTVEHVYGTPGVYTVTLVASNPAGSTAASTAVTVVTGVEPPRAAIAPLPLKVVTGQFVTLQSVSLNEPTRLRWDLGDGTRASGTAVSHAWSEPGTYRVRLTAENSEGADSTFIDVNVTKRIDPPVSQITQSATEVLLGETVTFRSLSLNEPTRLVWDFGDGTTARGGETSKSWSEPGSYRVTLRASNDAGTNRTGVTITVVKPVDPPVAAFNASPLILQPGQAVSLQDTSTNNPTRWNWDFGDGNTATSANTTHVYADEGTYSVRLTVSNEGGTSSAERTIVVKPPPSANFRWESEGRSVKFTDTSWDDPQQWSWNFGDGNTSNDRSPTHVFQAGGSYEVTLVVSNESGQSSPKTQTVTVGDPAVADFSCDADGAFLTCDASASENAVSYRWSANDVVINTNPDGRVTTFAFDSGGRKNITLEVTNAQGATDSVTERAPRVSRLRAPRVSEIRVVSQDGDLIRLEAEFDRDPTGWEWSVDGATLVEGGDSSTPVFRVPSNGTYSGVVRASNQVGADTDDFSFEVDGFVTQAAFDWEIVEPGVVKLTNRSIASEDAEYEWIIRGNVEVLDDDPAGPTLRVDEDESTVVVVLFVQDENGDDRLRRDIEL